MFDLISKNDQKIAKIVQNAIAAIFHTYPLLVTIRIFQAVRVRPDPRNMPSEEGAVLSRPILK